MKKDSIGYRRIKVLILQQLKL